MGFSKPLGIWFQSSGVSMEEGSPLDRIFLIVLLCLGLIILATRRFNWSKAIKENIWLMLLIAYMLVSCMWSDFPFTSFKRWTRELIVVIMALVVSTEPNPQKALEALFRRIIYILIPFSYVLINYFGEYGRAYVHQSGTLMWIGVTLHKNQLGQLCLFAAFYLIWEFFRRQRRRNISAARYQTYLEAFILILTFFILGGPQHSFTYSATTTATFSIGSLALIVLFWKKKKRKRNLIFEPKAMVVLIVVIFIYGTVTPIVGRLSLIDLSSVLGRDVTLTGRTLVWEQLLPAVMERPILGHGYGGFWSTKNRESYDISGSHNGYLSVILELGFVGLAILSMFVLSSCRKASKEMNHNFDWDCFKICFLLMVVLHNITESSIDTFTSRMMVIILFLAVSPKKVIICSPRVSRKLRYHET